MLANAEKLDCSIWHRFVDQQGIVIQMTFHVTFERAIELMIFHLCR